MWNENVPEIPTATIHRREPIDLDALDDGRCKASSWRVRDRTQKPTYENHFGPGGFNRCVGGDGHVNPLHKDEWGYVFSVDPYKTIRHEEPQ